MVQKRRRLEKILDLNTKRKVEKRISELETKKGGE